MRETIKQIRKISEVEFPQELHGRIMRTLYLRQFRLPLLIINFFLFLNFLVSGWRIWTAAQAEALVNAEPYLSYLSRSLSAIPPTSFFGLLFSFSLLAIGLYVLYKLQASLLQVGRLGSRRQTAEPFA